MTGKSLSAPKKRNLNQIHATEFFALKQLCTLCLDYLNGEPATPQATVGDGVAGSLTITLPQADVIVKAFNDAITEKGAEGVADRCVKVLEVFPLYELSNTHVANARKEALEKEVNELKEILFTNPAMGVAHLFTLQMPVLAKVIGDFYVHLPYFYATTHPTFYNTFSKNKTMKAAFLKEVLLAPFRVNDLRIGLPFKLHLDTLGPKIYDKFYDAVAIAVAKHATSDELINTLLPAPEEEMDKD